MPTTFQRSPLFAFVRSPLFARNNYAAHCRATHVMASHLFHGFAPYVDWLMGTATITSDSTQEEKDYFFGTEVWDRGFYTPTVNDSRATDRFMHAGGGPASNSYGFVDYRHQTRFRKITYYSEGENSFATDDDPPEIEYVPWTRTRIELVNEHYGWVYSISDVVTIDGSTVYNYSWVRSLTTGVITETDPVPTFPTLDWGGDASLNIDGAEATWTVEETSTTQDALLTMVFPRTFGVGSTTQKKRVTMEQPYTTADCLADAIELLDQVPLTTLPSLPTYRIDDEDDQAITWNESYCIEYTGYPLAPRISRLDTGDPGHATVGKWWQDDDTFAAYLPTDEDNAIALDNGFAGWGILVAKIKTRDNGEPTCLVTTEQNEAVPTTVYTPDDGTHWTFETADCLPDPEVTTVEEFGPGDVATAWGTIVYWRYCASATLEPECCGWEYPP
jgi:hypothetical protein